LARVSAWVVGLVAMRSNISHGTDTQRQNAASRQMLRAGQLRR
jgi:hypothetical protein